MFLFEAIPWYSALMWFVVVAGLMFFNELARTSKWAGLALFIVLPILLTIFVWPTTAGAGSSTGSWFHWVKVYSALAGCIGFMALRYIPRFAKNKYALMFPAAILAINIAEAVIRDFEVTSMNGMVDGVMMVGGSWNVMNGIAGILNLLTICGWAGIFISRGKQKDMIWPDMLWFWITPTTCGISPTSTTLWATTRSTRVRRCWSPARSRPSSSRRAPGSSIAPRRSPSG